MILITDEEFAELLGDTEIITDERLEAIKAAVLVDLEAQHELRCVAARNLSSRERTTLIKQVMTITGCGLLAASKLTNP